jgi:hypothetical protein
MWQQAQEQRDYDVVQDFIEFSLQWLQDRRYTLAIDVDMASWTRVMTDAMSAAAVNPTFNPHINGLSPQNSFWLDIRAGSHTVATMAARLFVTDDYLALKRSMRLWHDAPPATLGELTLSLPPQMPRIAGQVGHEGGLWIHPEHRKRGLSVVLPHLIRALCLRQWNIDWQTGVTRRGIGECGIAKWAYGVPHVEPCFEGFFPITQAPDRLFIAYMSRGELLSGLDANAVATRLPETAEPQPSYAAALARKR